MTKDHWYMITSDGYVTLCADRLDAEQTARDADAEWPRHAPHRAVQLVELSAVYELRTAAQAVVDRWDTPLWKDVPHTGEYIARLRRALNCIDAELHGNAALPGAVLPIDASRVVSILTRLAVVDFGAAGWSADADSAARDARDILTEYSSK